MNNFKILLIGNSNFLNFLSTIFEHEGINVEYVQLEASYESVDFFEPFYVPEAFFSQYFSEKKAFPLKFIFFNNDKLIPIVNNLKLFSEVLQTFSVKKKEIDTFKNFLNSKVIFNLHYETFLKKNFSKLFISIINSLLYFYNYKYFDTLKLKKFQEIMKNFFSENYTFNYKIPKKNIVNVSGKNIKRFNNYILIDKTPFTFDYLISDLTILNNILELEENFVEFKIKKEYTTEYFPDNIIFNFNNNFSKLTLYNTDDKYKYYTLTNENNLKLIYDFFKNYFPLLINDDLIVIKKGIKKYKNFLIDKNELFSYNFYEKSIYILKEVLKNGKKKRIK